MDRTLRFRQLLTSRLFQVAGAAAFATPAGVALSCGGNVVVDPVDGAGGAGSVTSTTSLTTAITTGVTTSVGPTVSVTTTTTSSGGDPTYACFPWLGDAECPSGGNALSYVSQFDCAAPHYAFTTAVLDGPFPELDQCCYVVQQDICGVGRPFLVNGAPMAATARGRAEGGGAGSWSAGGLSPEVEGLDAEEREILARAWAQDGLLEHASVAAFARFALELLAAGAPAALVEAAHRAALDEVRHARLCLSMAATYRGGPVEPGPLPCGGSVSIGPDLAAFAADTAREGCVGETVAAILAAEQLSRATDPAVRKALFGIAEDEARHAELAFRAVAWALRVGGDDVRAAVAEVFDQAARDGVKAGGVNEDPRGVLESHGRLTVGAAREAAARALHEVVLPSARALLA
ncbi:ferritin-like domain-containing protein [Chondromyces crocatus]|uniref:Ferritin-like domain-containing protein n=1 Tax=Chondromyces crocatus TaxID=52 RepID=A0A0K1ERW9_CHOCO|nr:ferritin-like domain-containing protein [Chondromyces crocatus]AKT43665.1 uncharacterized protein CMC5_079000 [Chondromyces crocatus]